jgi:hypothetical protein
VYRPIVARQQLGKKNFTAETNIHATISRTFGHVVSYSVRVGDQLFPELLVFFQDNENRLKLK